MPDWYANIRLLLLFLQRITRLKHQLLRLSIGLILDLFRNPDSLLLSGSELTLCIYPTDYKSDADANYTT